MACMTYSQLIDKLSEVCRMRYGISGVNKVVEMLDKLAAEGVAEDCGVRVQLDKKPGCFKMYYVIRQPQ